MASSGEISRMTSSRLPPRQAPPDLIEIWMADPQAAREAARGGGSEWRSAIECAARLTPAKPAFVHDALSAAVFDAEGGLLWAQERFVERFDELVPSPDLVVSAMGVRQPKIFACSARDGSAALIVCTPIDGARSWPLTQDCREAAAAPRAAILALAISTGEADETLSGVARAYGLTAMEARIAAALVHGGDLRKAAKRAGLAYSTARQAFQSILRKTGTSRQSAAVALFSRMTSGLARDPSEEAACLIDQFGLSLREARLVPLLSDGMTRTESRPCARFVGRCGEGCVCAHFPAARRVVGCRAGEDRCGDTHGSSACNSNRRRIGSCASSRGSFAFAAAQSRRFHSSQRFWSGRWRADLSLALQCDDTPSVAPSGARLTRKWLEADCH